CAAGRASCRGTLRMASPSCGKDWLHGVQQGRNFTLATVSPEQRKRISLPEKLRMDYGSYVKRLTKAVTPGVRLSYIDSTANCFSKRGAAMRRNSLWTKPLKRHRSKVLGSLS